MIILSKFIELLILCCIVVVVELNALEKGVHFVHVHVRWRMCRLHRVVCDAMSIRIGTGSVMAAALFRNHRFRVFAVI